MVADKSVDDGRQLLKVQEYLNNLGIASSIGEVKTMSTVRKVHAESLVCFIHDGCYFFVQSCQKISMQGKSF